MRPRNSTVGTLVTVVVLSSAGARAAQPATVNTLQIDGGFRYGFDQEEGDFNPWGPGLGIAIGYTLESAVYLGGNVEYFFGEGEKPPLADVTADVFQLMAEVGYDLGLNDTLVLRPKLGAGIALTESTQCDVDVCTTGGVSDFAIAPGAAFLYLGESFSFGVDVRYDMIFADEETLNAILLSIGIGF